MLSEYFYVMQVRDICLFQYVSASWWVTTHFGATLSSHGSHYFTVTGIFSPLIIFEEKIGPFSPYRINAARRFQPLHTVGFLFIICIFTIRRLATYTFSMSIGIDIRHIMPKIQ